MDDMDRDLIAEIIAQQDDETVATLIPMAREAAERKAAERRDRR